MAIRTPISPSRSSIRKVSSTSIFFKLVVDYNTGRYVSFQFAGRTWDLSSHELMVFEPDTGHDRTPAMFELNVRLITYDNYDGPYRMLTSPHEQYQ